MTFIHIKSNGFICCQLALQNAKHLHGWLFQRWMENEVWQMNISWIEAVHCSLYGSVNSYNCHIWANSNPHVYIEVSLMLDKYHHAFCIYHISYNRTVLLLESLFHRHKKLHNNWYSIMCVMFYFIPFRNAIFRRLPSSCIIELSHTTRQVMELLRINLCIYANVEVMNSLAEYPSLKDVIRQAVRNILVDRLSYGVSVVIPRLHSILEYGGEDIEQSYL